MDEYLKVMFKAVEHFKKPLYGKNAEEYIKEFLPSGLKVIIVTTMTEHLDERYIERNIDDSFMKDLPENVDICGENGEHHTFCHDGPIFSSPVTYTLEEPVKRTYTFKFKDGRIREFSK
ncbi:hypothetical protein BB560_006844, partial [Smittium megazygosporum]